MPNSFQSQTLFQVYGILNDPSRDVCVRQYVSEKHPNCKCPLGWLLDDFTLESIQILNRNTSNIEQLSDDDLLPFEWQENSRFLYILQAIIDDTFDTFQIPPPSGYPLSFTQKMHIYSNVLKFEKEIQNENI
jgi:hypothetical protein